MTSFNLDLVVVVVVDKDFEQSVLGLQSFIRSNLI